MLPRCAVTISLVPEAKGGPFVFWGDLEANAAISKEIGFDGIEIFAPSASVLEKLKVGEVLHRNGLRLAALGTGAGWLLQRLSLTSSDSSIRSRSIEFIKEIMDFGAPFGAPAILGSMQGKVESPEKRDDTLAYLAEGIEVLGEHATKLGVPLLYEPLNRYETNLLNRIADTRHFLETLQTKNVRILIDLFHANIEEASTVQAIVDTAQFLGHVHFVDSNRRAAGLGQTNFSAISQALRSISYSGWLSAEALPLPDSETAARTTYKTYHGLFSPGALEPKSN